MPNKIGPKRVGVVGMGYVGLTLTAALARAGNEVHGVDAKPAVRESLSRGRPHIYEPGVEEVFAACVGSSIFIGTELPRELDAVTISVSTPVDETTHRPDLTFLEAAIRDIVRWCAPGTLVVVRSTVPIGTSRRVVLPVLREAWGDDVRLAMAPERTIQGQALRELVELPQVVGALDEASLAAAVDVFGALATQVVPVSQLETAEMVKLSNNCHTDLIYSFGNELALIAESHGLDPLEVIRAANFDYPRPDLAKPGYVGGGCLTKDPYIMIDSAGRTPFLVGQARKLNEYLPEHVGRTVVDLVRRHRGSTAGARVSVLGWAYKGWPATDDMRGTPVAAIAPILADAGITVLGHDPLVADDVIRQYGGEPVGLDKALSEPDGILLVNDHPDYRALQVDLMLAGSNAKFVFDSWRILDEPAVRAAGIGYAGIGYQAPRVPEQRRDADADADAGSRGRLGEVPA
jgi:UDP-N-acetyl-D-mannosaminuronic acid dehydrogenase